MTYEESLEFLYSQLPMFSRIGPPAYKANLDNIKSLCESLGNPHSGLTCIHVAGTNGKGSTSHMLAAVLQEAGFKTGLYTSPHVKEFGERIRVNGQMIEPSFVIDFVEKIMPAFDTIKPSFFEVTVAMAFSYFRFTKTDIAVIETGLGGRLDSTNIITPVLSVVTNIGMDHTDLLGKTLEAIAGEKAGIIKKNIPVVIGEVLPETKEVFVNKSIEENAAIHFAEENYIIEYIDPEGGLLLCNIRNIATNIVEKLRLDLPGIYQAKNARTLLCCIQVLRESGIQISESHLHKGLENVKGLTGLRGRWDVIGKEPTVIVDVAHNREGIREINEHLQSAFPSSHVHFILGFVKDKEIKPLLEMFPVTASYYFTNAHIPRALLHSELKQLAEVAGLQGESYDDINQALSHARQAAAKDDIIFICGSFFILAELAD